MKLQLYLNRQLSAEIHLPDEDFEDAPDYSWENNAMFREEKLNEHVADMINIYCTKMLKAQSWEIVFVAESKLNKKQLKYEYANT